MPEPEVSLSTDSGKPTCLLDREHRIQTCNPAMLGLLGKSQDQVAGRHCCEIINGFAVCDGFCPLLRMYASGRTERSVMKLGGRRFEATADPLFDRGGKISGVLHTFSEVIRPELTTAALCNIQRNESVAQMSVSVVHDLNNILFAVRGFLPLLQQKISGDETITHIIETVEDASDRGAEMCKQLMMFNAGCATTNTTVDVTEILREAAGFALMGARLSHVFTLAEGVWPVWGSREQLRLMLLNLVMNARQACDDGREIKMSADNVGEAESLKLGLPKRQHVRLVIEDNGRGMLQDEMRHLFSPFFTTKRTGTGLGLSMANLVAREHGGIILFESEPGRGTVVRVYLPASLDDRARRAAAEFAEVLKSASFCLDISSTRKEEIIAEMISRLHEDGRIEDFGACLMAVLAREKSMSTGMQNGIATPHGKTSSVRNLVVAIGIKRDGVDFHSMDGKPSQIFIMTLSPPNDTGPHIRFLGEIARTLKGAGARERLIQSRTIAQMVDALTAP